MEHQTLTSISPDFNSEYVIPHELSHQWAGDKITCVNFHHMWLNEGFASYSEALYFKYQYGDYYYKDWLESQKHLDAGTPYVEDLINDNIFDPITVYDKGGWVVYMLHMILGDSLFLETMDQYFNDPVLAFGAASTDDLKGICEVAYGQDLDWFFNTWIYQPGNPNYVYSLRSDPDPVNGGYDVFLLIRQVQSWALFPMPIDVKIFTAGPDTAFTVFNNQRGQLWKVDLPYPADSAWLDPDEKILRTVEYDPEFTLSIMVEKLTDTAYIGQPYYAEYYTLGAEGDCNWRKISGQIPYGLALHNFDTAYIDGTPTWAADYVFSLEATDSDVPPNADTITLKIVVLQSEAPAIPQLIAPVNLSTISDNTPQFMWSSTAGAGGNYTLQYARNISFTQELTTQAGIADTFYTPAAALGEGLWYWHAEAVNSGGSHSGYQASPFRFTINSQGQIRGDCNHDDYVDVSDAVYIINYVFVGGPPPVPYEIGDANCDEYVDVGDAVYIINYVFVGGPPPCSL